MALVPTGIAFALGALANATGQSLQYRTTPAGTWAALPNAFLLPAAPVLIGYDDQRNAIMAPMNARLKSQVGNPHLTPGATNAQVKDQNGTVWQVVGADHSVGQSIYELQRAIYQSEGKARGSVPQ